MQSTRITTNWLAGPTTKEELEKAYRALAKAFHPDLGGDGEVMKQINLEYETRCKQLEAPEPARRWVFDPYNLLNEDAQMAYGEIMVSVFDYELENRVKVEITDSLEIWVSGQTYALREDLKACGFWWQPSERAWKFIRWPKRKAA